MITLRRLTPTDGPQAGEVFFDAVQRGTTEFYTQEQRSAWAGTTLNRQAWQTRLSGCDGFAAIHTDQLVGFMTIDKTGYIDLAFVRADYLGQGIGTRLFHAVETTAQATKIDQLSTHASLKAQPFFAARGFATQQQQEVIVNNVAMTNFVMIKNITNS